MRNILYIFEFGSQTYFMKKIINLILLISHLLNDEKEICNSTKILNQFQKILHFFQKSNLVLADEFVVLRVKHNPSTKILDRMKKIFIRNQKNRKTLHQKI